MFADILVYALVNSSLALPGTLLLFTRMVELYRPGQHLRRVLCSVWLKYYYPRPTRIRVKLMSVSGLNSRIRVKLLSVALVRFQHPGETIVSHSGEILESG